MQNRDKLEKLYNLIGEEQLSKSLDVTRKTLKNWLKDDSIFKESIVAAKLDNILESIVNPHLDAENDFTFIDLFA